MARPKRILNKYDENKNGFVTRVVEVPWKYIQGRVNVIYIRHSSSNESRTIVIVSLIDVIFHVENHEITGGHI